MKTTKILYWVFNILFAIVMFGSGLPGVLGAKATIHGMHEVMGYPLYFIPFLGVAKMLGAIAILIPGFPRIKEWAYAGLTFDLIAATYSLYCIPNPEGPWYGTLIFVALAAAAYIYYHKKLALTKQA
ncbi:MAG: DoxX-like family protein [Mucilaginibacter sp.]|nr:DoxX-like family protein [Mucilaginibacter sp.]